MIKILVVRQIEQVQAKNEKNPHQGRDRDGAIVRFYFVISLFSSLYFMLLHLIIV